MDMLLRVLLLLRSLLVLHLLDGVKVLQNNGGDLCVCLPVFCQQALNISDWALAVTTITSLIGDKSWTLASLCGACATTWGSSSNLLLMPFKAVLISSKRMNTLLSAIVTS